MSFGWNGGHPKRIDKLEKIYVCRCLTSTHHIIESYVNDLYSSIWRRPVRDSVCFIIMYYKVRRITNGILVILTICEKELKSITKD